MSLLLFSSATNWFYDYKGLQRITKDYKGLQRKLVQILQCLESCVNMEIVEKLFLASLSLPHRGHRN